LLDDKLASNHMLSLRSLWQLIKHSTTNRHLAEAKTCKHVTAVCLIGGNPVAMTPRGVASGQAASGEVLKRHKPQNISPLRNEPHFFLSPTGRLQLLYKFCRYFVL